MRAQPGASRRSPTPPSGRGVRGAPARPLWPARPPRPLWKRSRCRARRQNRWKQRMGRRLPVAPRSGAANGEDPSKVAGRAARLSCPGGKQRRAAALSPAQADQGSGGIRAVQRTAGGNGAAADRPARKARRSCCRAGPVGAGRPGAQLLYGERPDAGGPVRGAGGGGRFLPEAGAALERELPGDPGRIRTEDRDRAGACGMRGSGRFLSAWRRTQEREGTGSGWGIW